MRGAAHAPTCGVGPLFGAAAVAGAAGDCRPSRFSGPLGAASRQHVAAAARLDRGLSLGFVAAAGPDHGVPVGAAGAVHRGRSRRPDALPRPAAGALGPAPGPAPRARRRRPVGGGQRLGRRVAVTVSRPALLAGTFRMARPGPARGSRSMLPCGRCSPLSLSHCRSYLAARAAGPYAGKNP